MRLVQGVICLRSLCNDSCPTCEDPAFKTSESGRDLLLVLTLECTALGMVVARYANTDTPSFSSGGFVVRQTCYRELLEAEVPPSQFISSAAIGSSLWSKGHNSHGYRSLILSSEPSSPTCVYDIYQFWTGAIFQDDRQSLTVTRLQICISSHREANVINLIFNKVFHVDLLILVLASSINYFFIYI
jgi:hypothetical protein